MALVDAIRHRLWRQAACSALALLLTAPTLTAQLRPTEAVRSFDDLRARTDEQRVRARHFDRYNADVPDVPAVDPFQKFLGNVCNFPIINIPPAEIEGTPEERDTYQKELPQLMIEWALGMERARRDSICPRTHIFVGRAVSSRTRMNTRENWLFTDHILTIDRWLLRRTPPDSVPMPAVSTLLWSEGAGSVDVGGRHVSSGTLTWPPHAASASVFLLEPLPGTRGFVGEALEVKDGKVFDEFAMDHLDLEDFIRRTLRAAAACRSRQ